MLHEEESGTRDQSKPLSNMRIAITSVDLEQSEHRGIAYLSKSLIRSLSDQGAQVYLLTGFYGRRLSPIMRFLMHDVAVNEVDSADILDQLSDEKSQNKKKKNEIDPDITTLEKFFEFINNVRGRFLKTIFLFKPIFKYYFRCANFSGKLIELKDLKRSPYWGNERINYLKYVNGFLSIPDIFLLSTLRSRRILIKSPVIDLRKHNIDFLITTCPLSISVKGRQRKSSKLLQLIMDYIPLSFYKHPDHPYSFYNRLQDSMKSNCCFISKTSQKKICQLLDKKVDKYKNDIIYPMPSLSFENLNLASNLDCIRKINYKFILFNSSIVPRKNLHFLIQAFQNSEIAAKGFKLCVAGKIHDDKYGLGIQKLCNNNSNIELLGYVDEIEKCWLFLNAHAFASPSCVEGFGIPVLDAYILGLNVLASNIPSHKEIANISVQDSNLNLLDLNNINSWIFSLNDIAENEDISSLTRMKRIDNFKKSLTKLTKSFDAKLCELITQQN